MTASGLVLLPTMRKMPLAFILYKSLRLIVWPRLRSSR